jgi:hypothetical protein
MGPLETPAPDARVDIHGGRRGGWAELGERAELGQGYLERPPGDRAVRAITGADVHDFWLPAAEQSGLPGEDGRGRSAADPDLFQHAVRDVSGPTEVGGHAWPGRGRSGEWYGDDQGN